MRTYEALVSRRIVVDLRSIHFEWMEAAGYMLSSGVCCIDKRMWGQDSTGWTPSSKLYPATEQDQQFSYAVQHMGGTLRNHAFRAVNDWKHSTSFSPARGPPRWQSNTWRISRSHCGRSFRSTAISTLQPALLLSNRIFHLMREA